MTFELPDGRGMRKGLEFIVPYIVHKSRWFKAPDVTYWDEWPVRHPSLLLTGLHLNTPEYVDIWKDLEADPTTSEVVRNLPLRHPLVWTKLEGAS